MVVFISIFFNEKIKVLTVIAFESVELRNFLAPMQSSIHYKFKSIVAGYY